jgi:meso-butanediol dehydrogenase/(S,S)-butanediol dehydrogenase/diacetyl reductase
MTLEGKVALITGAGRGIGRGIALRLARDGADVALVDVVPDGINAVADEVAEIGSKATTFVADVSDRQQVFAAVDYAASALGGFDVMVNNAGIALVGPIAEVTPEDAARVWAINVDGVRPWHRAGTPGNT